MHWTVGVLCWAAVALTLAFAVCRLLGLWTRTASWLKSTTEEKANLTRSGIYNANGFMIKTDADEFGGDNYNRFDVVDAEYPMTAMTIFPINHRESSIPPQPLRPAPVILPQETKISNRATDLNTNNEDKKLEMPDSFYHYNISNISNKSMIAPASSKDIEPKEQSNSIKSASVFNNEQLDEIIVISGHDQHDWMTKNNLNIYKKPDYTSTNPFINGNQINGQFNPFYSPSNSQIVLSDELEETTQYDELTNECDIQRDINIHHSNRISQFLRKRSYDNDCDTDDGIAAISGSSGAVRRAISCDSVSSDTSLGPFETPLPTVTGQLCLSLRCFRINSNDSLLAVNVIEARNLQGECPDTYVGIFLSPEHKGGHFKTKICRGTNCPSYNETFLVDIGKTNKKLCFHIYNTENDACSLIGETELSLQDAGSYKQPVTTWLTLTDTGQGAVEFGELMLSLSYLPTAERLTLILTRARRLPDPTDYNIFIKVYLQKNGKKVAKKRSSIKRSETSPTFNEAFIFSVPPHLLSSVELRITLVYFPIGLDYLSVEQHQKIGHIVLCHNAKGKPSNHWNQMIASLRKPVSMWHTLRRPHI